MLGVDIKTLSEIPGEPLPDYLPLKPGKLRNLATGRGIEIGDAPEKVRHVMGAPTWQGSSKYSAGERVWTYHRKVGTDKDGMEYVSLFRFRHSSVTGIEIRSDLLGGG